MDTRELIEKAIEAFGIRCVIEFELPRVEFLDLFLTVNRECGERSEFFNSDTEIRIMRAKAKKFSYCLTSFRDEEEVFLQVYVYSTATLFAVTRV